jgi:tetratricopeptide (TPR) repeat protein
MSIFPKRLINLINLSLLIQLLIINGNSFYSQNNVEQTIETRLKTEQNSEEIKKLKSEFSNLKIDNDDKINNEIEKSKDDIKSLKNNVEDRSKAIDWWLAILGILISFFGLVIPIIGALFSKRISDKIEQQKNDASEDLNLFIMDKKNEFEYFKTDLFNQLSFLLKEAENHTEIIKENSEYALQYTNQLKNNIKLENYSDKVISNLRTAKSDTNLFTKLQTLQSISNSAEFENILNLTEEILSEITDSNSKAEIHLIRSNTFSRMNDLLNAEKEIRKAISLNKQNYKYWFNLGNILSNDSNFYESEKAYLESIRLESNDFKPSAGLANFYYNHGKYKDAERYAELSKQIGGGNNEMLLLGNTKYMLGKYQEAIEIYKDLVVQDKSNVSYWSNLGLIYVKLEMFIDALSCYDKSIALDPKNPIWYDQKGAILISHEKYDEAEICFNKAIDLNQDYYHGYMNLFEYYIMFKQKNELDEFKSRMRHLKREELQKYFGFHFLSVLEMIVSEDVKDITPLLLEFEDVMVINDIHIEWNFQDLRNMLRSENLAFKDANKRHQIIQLIDFTQNLKFKQQL